MRRRDVFEVQNITERFGVGRPDGDHGLWSRDDQQDYVATLLKEPIGLFEEAQWTGTVEFEPFSFTGSNSARRGYRIFGYR
jgi:hypothetical protein